MRKHKALYFFMGRSSFVEKDLSIYQETFEVKAFNFDYGIKWKIPFQLISQLFFLIRNLANYNVCFIQLAGIHSVLPVFISKLAGKKCIIIAGGTDCHSFPSIGYGNYQRTFLAMATRFSFRFCTLILPKHQTLWQTPYTYDKNDFPEQGIAYFNKGIKTPYFCIENGYDENRFRKINDQAQNSFITVAGLLHKSSQQKLKGIDLILEVAKLFPNYSFTIVGGKPGIFNNLSANITLLPAVPNSELPLIFSRHQYYLQLSMAEGFPNALCEAMLCECIPIGSDVFSIPEIIGETGYILKERNSQALKKLIESLPASDPVKNGRSARERIRNHYSLEKRREKFKKIFESPLISGSR